ncbi:acyl carrier protein [Clostridium tepidiprofundi DSM 19306]|uniref:Acyl carrier protein n=1 Tax=Clostridium tepidiprofundi DSM 19306 TaxID=1121338 RepID=A0A151B3C9_9CLOT|nr:acyl carrier protein [Clostridium tepidiprofundi]KYH34439.1 acyl carrier protein [Clostridium tepidiprofundi DSM 19306]
MNFEQVIKEVNEIFIDVLDNDEIELKYETTADDVEDWDSLTHIELIVEIEKHFNIKFTLVEVQNFKNVGEMCEAIVKKTN